MAGSLRSASPLLPLLLPLIISLSAPRPCFLVSATVVTSRVQFRKVRPAQGWPLKWWYLLGTPAMVAQLNSMAQSSPTRPEDVGPCRVRQLEASSGGSTPSSPREMGKENGGKQREEQRH